MFFFSVLFSNLNYIETNEIIEREEFETFVKVNKRIQNFKEAGRKTVSYQNIL
jgi:hypothetical protein